MRYPSKLVVPFLAVCAVLVGETSLADPEFPGVERETPPERTAPPPREAPPERTAPQAKEAPPERTTPQREGPSISEGHGAVAQGERAGHNGNHPAVGQSAPVSAVKTPPHAGDYFETKDATVSVGLRPMLNRVAEEFFKETGRTLIVTSGVRDAAQQAQAMYDAFEKAAKPLSPNVYAGAVGKSIAQVLKEIADEGKVSGPNAAAAEQVAVAQMASVINAFNQMGIHISLHTVERAVDFSVKGVGGDGEKLDMIMGSEGYKRGNEKGGGIPHYHYQSAFFEDGALAKQPASHRHRR